jgi:hypothetical protein
MQAGQREQPGIVGAGLADQVAQPVYGPRHRAVVQARLGEKPVRHPGRRGGGEKERKPGPLGGRKIEVNRDRGTRPDGSHLRDRGIRGSARHLLRACLGR